MADKSPQWAGEGFRVPINFTNGQAEMTVVEWEEYSEELVEATKQLKEDVKMDAVKTQVAEAIRLATKPLYFHTYKKARVPNGLVPFRIGDVVSNTKLIPAMLDYIQDNFANEPVFTPKGIECGFSVL